MRIPAPPPPQPGVRRRTMARAHAVDGAWNRLLRDAETVPAFITNRADRALDGQHAAARRHLAVQCRRHAASVYRKLDAVFPPYRVMAATVAHP